MPLTLTSSNFRVNTLIPIDFTCEGTNVNPGLKIEGVPSEAKSLVLIMDDPDAATDPDGPGKTFDHWILFNIPASTTEIAENSFPSQSVAGSNTAGQTKYTGPCPPNGTHRYFFTLYAIDKLLDLPEGSSKENVLTAIKDNVLEKTQLIGLYKKTGVQ